MACIYTRKVSLWRTADIQESRNVLALDRGQAVTVSFLCIDTRTRALARTHTYTYIYIYTSGLPWLGELHSLAMAYAIQKMEFHIFGDLPTIRLKQQNVIFSPVISLMNILIK